MMVDFPMEDPSRVSGGNTKATNISDKPNNSDVCQNRREKSRLHSVQSLEFITSPLKFSKPDVRSSNTPRSPAMPSVVNARHHTS